MKRPIIKLKRCAQCGGEWDEEAGFRRNSHGFAVSGVLDTRPCCIGCELTDRNDPTRHG